MSKVRFPAHLSLYVHKTLYWSSAQIQTQVLVNMYCSSLHVIVRTSVGYDQDV